jgi:hypothetical protein
VSAKKVPAKKSSAKKAPAKKAAKKAVKKAAPKKTNIERLTAAGVIHPDHVARHNHKAINKLSTVEVNTLIKLRTKLGALDDADDDLSPNFPV